MPFLWRFLSISYPLGEEMCSRGRNNVTLGHIFSPRGLDLNIKFPILSLYFSCFKWWVYIHVESSFVMAMQTTFWRKNGKQKVIPEQLEASNVEEKARGMIKRSTGKTLYAVGEVRTFWVLFFVVRKFVIVLLFSLDWTLRQNRWRLR